MISPKAVHYGLFILFQLVHLSASHMIYTPGLKNTFSLKFLQTLLTSYAMIHFAIVGLHSPVQLQTGLSNTSVLRNTNHKRRSHERFVPISMAEYIPLYYVFDLIPGF